MAVIDAKFSTFDNGGDLIPGDIVVGLRGGINTKFNNTGGVGTFLPLTGGTMLGVIDMGGFKITNLATPTDPADAVTKQYVDVIAAGTALTSVDDTNVTLVLGGSPSTALLHAASLTLGWTGQLSLARGGTNANLTAANGAIPYSTSSALALLAPGTSGQMLQSGGAGAPSWTTATFPASAGSVGTFLRSNGTGWVASTATLADTYSVNTILYAASSNAVSGLAAVNSAAMVSTSSGVPTWAAMTDGKVMIGVTGGTPVAAAIGSGSGILVGNGAGSITVALNAIADQRILANISGGSLAPSANTLTAIIDSCIGSTQGDLLYRNASSWVVLAPGTSGQFLQTQGAAANPQWVTSATVTPAALTKTDDTNVTLTLGGTPTTALLQATSLTLGWTGQLSLARGGTNASLTAANGAIPYSTASALALLAPGTSGQLLQSGGAGAPSWTTATFPTSVGASGTILRSNGTNWLASTATFADTYGLSTILYASSANTVSGLATANSSVLVTSSGGVPSLSTTLPSGIAATNMALTTPTIKGSNGFNVVTFDDAALTTDYFSFTSGTANNAVMSIVSSNSNASFAINGKGTGGVAINVGQTATQPFALYFGSFNLGFNVGSLTNNRTITFPDGNVTLVTGTMAPTASPTFTGTVTIPTPFTLGATSVTSTGTQLNYLNALTAVPINKVNVQRVTASGAGTYTPTSGMVYVIVRAQAGGGAGGGAATSDGTHNSSGAGGGGGEYIEALFTAANIGASKAFSVGAGGTAGTAGNNPGNAGSNTTFNTTWIVATGGGGGGGTAATLSATPQYGNFGGSGGTGGSVATGTLLRQMPGTAGGGSYNLGVGVPGFGGASGAGGGGANFTITASNAGISAVANSGGGGSGASTNNGTQQAGGVGGSGFLEFIEYLSA